MTLGRLSTCAHTVSLFAVLAISPASASAHEQTAPEVESGAPRASRQLFVSALNQSMGFHLAGGLFRYAPSPGIVFGAEHTWKQSGRWRLFQTAGVGYLYQPRTQHGILACTEVGGSVSIYGGFRVESLAGVAGFHSLNLRPSYDPATGERRTEWGRPTLMPSLAVGIAFVPEPDARLPIGVFVRQAYLLQAPFAPGIGAPVIPQSALQLGVRYRFDS